MLYLFVTASKDHSESAMTDELLWIVLEIAHYLHD